MARVIIEYNEPQLFYASAFLLFLAVILSLFTMLQAQGVINQNIDNWNILANRCGIFPFPDETSTLRVGEALQRNSSDASTLG